MVIVATQNPLLLYCALNKSADYTVFFIIGYCR